MTATACSNGRGDFDFLHGAWNVSHRKLRSRLTGDDQWQEFDGTMQARAILAGAGNIDENVLHDPGGTYEACTLRMYDEASGQWSIFWIDGRNLRPDPPVIGAFNGGDGTFLGEDTHDGQPVMVRFIWSRTGPDHARWEQAFSGDSGASWEPNWTMDFERQS